MNYSEIYSKVNYSKKFGVSPLPLHKKTLKDGQDVGISNGIKYLIENEPKAEEEIFQALERFYNADFGTMYETEYELAMKPTTWDDIFSYGEYDISSLEGMPIYIHYQPYGMTYDVIVYLSFER